MLTSLVRQCEVAGLHKQACKLLVGLLNTLYVEWLLQWALPALALQPYHLLIEFT